MIRGIYTSASSMLCENIRMDMTANNLANVDTVGFKRDQGIFKELPTMELRRVNDGKLYPPRPIYKYPKIGELGTGVILDESFTDFKGGKMEYTGNDLDIALENEKAFLLVEGPNGLRFSRDGALTIDHEGYLTNMNGDYIMAERDPVNEIEGEQLIDENGNPSVNLMRVQVGDQQKVLIDEDGRVLIDGEPQFRISRGQAADRKAFRKEGSNKFVRAYGAVTRALGNVKQGYIEKPNFSLVEEMVKMIEVSRAYEANSKVIQSHDGLLDKAINSVGVTRR
ncbi:MAG: flagellar basal-body rod protein FlgF [Candidatus Rifleibacteriota bacterium]